MKALISCLCIVLMGLASCDAISQKKLSISAADFETRLVSGSYQLLDVRTAGEYKSGHIKNALQADWFNKQQFEERTKYLDKSKPLLVYCASGVRSEQAAKWFLKNGFAEVYNLEGGTSGWQISGKKLEADMAIQQMSVQTFQHQIQTKGLVLVDVGAEWCPPCKKMEPVLKSLHDELGSKYYFLKVDGGIDIDVMKAIKAAVLPTFIVYKDGKEIWRQEGIVELETLKAKLQ